MILSSECLCTRMSYHTVTLISYWLTTGPMWLISTSQWNCSYDIWLFATSDNSVCVVLSVVAALVGMMGATGIFGSLYFYTPELYPTNIRCDTLRPSNRDLGLLVIYLADSRFYRPLFLSKKNIKTHKKFTQRKRKEGQRSYHLIIAKNLFQYFLDPVQEIRIISIRFCCRSRQSSATQFSLCRQSSSVCLSWWKGMWQVRQGNRGNVSCSSSISNRLEIFYWCDLLQSTGCSVRVFFFVVVLFFFYKREPRSRGLEKQTQDLCQ